MKKLFLIIALLFSWSVQAQMLDLLDDDDASETMPGMPVAAPSAPAPAKKAISPVKPIPARVPPVAPTTPVVKVPENAPSIGSGPAVPSIGGSDIPSVPQLGDLKGVKKQEKRNSSESLFEMRKKSLSKRRRGKFKQRIFDVAGIRAGMNPSEVLNIATDKGFSLKFSNTHVPDLDAWKYKRACLNSGNLPYQILKSCIADAAKEGNSEYIQKLTFENKERKETLTVDFTSNTTENQAFRVFYLAKGDHSLGVTEEGLYLKNKRRRDFFNALQNKYGDSDFENSFVWADGDTGTILMADISDTFLDVSIELECSRLDATDLDKQYEKEDKEVPAGLFNF